MYQIFSPVHCMYNSLRFDLLSPLDSSAHCGQSINLLLRYSEFEYCTNVKDFRIQRFKEAVD